MVEHQHRKPSNLTVIYFFLNQGMSFTDRGTLMVLPFRLSDFSRERASALDLVDSTTLSAMSCPFSTAFFVTAEALVAALFPAVADFVAAFLVVDLAFPPARFAAEPALEAAFEAVALAPEAAFVAVSAAEEAAFAAVNTFLATATERPAFCRSFALALAILATVVNLASLSFVAVAAPTPGSEVMSESLFPMVSPRQ